MITYNERSWAIDVISEINLFLANKRWHFQGAGGENTISHGKKSLFPDVLLFQDSSKNIIVQGWELKMPDTPIHDSELINNAIKKAQILKRDSFLLWNVKSAVLYIKGGQGFEILKSWDDIDIHTRAEVKAKEALWKEQLSQILIDLNALFQGENLPLISTTEILSIDDIIDLILENTQNTAETLKAKIRTHTRLDAEIDHWWNSSSNEYGYKSTQKEQKLPTLSMVILTDWVFKIVFSHILKKHVNEAQQIHHIEQGTSISDAISIITHISQYCNFWNILSPNLGQEHISQTAWHQITELNQFLSSINIEAIDVEILQQLLQSSVAAAKRKVAGQYSTPQKLADLLTRLSIDDKTKVVIDPCCGTGTIIKQAYQLKEEYELTQEEILNSVWASDKHSFPVQLSTLSMARPDDIGRIINIFSSDVIDLQVGKSITFTDPNNGNEIEKLFPQVDYVVSNLPFIRNKEMKVLNPGILAINDWIQEQTGSKESLSGKSDMFAYIPFYLHQLLAEKGKIGLVLSNAWLGTDYGEIFLRLFQRFYQIEYVVISGKGKWFDNADVVTTLLIAVKKEPQLETEEHHQISFCTLHEKIEEIEDVKALSQNIILGNSSEKLSINSYTLGQIRRFENFGNPWSSYFANIHWIEEISDKLIQTNEIFHFTRGERRGWNPMFYPAPGHNIEEVYIKPVLKHLRNTKALSCIANAEAFCCSKSIAELESLGHEGALNWIRSFEHQHNGTNQPLPKVLAKPNMHWYEMTTENMADFVGNVNYDKSLFIAQFETRSFIDQRMIGLSIKETYQGENKLLYLALLNSTFNMFLIESFGFGRGLGALDLRANKFNKDFKILNPQVLSEPQKLAIIEAFRPIMQRNRLPLEQEIDAVDRIAFEQTLLEIYGISALYDPIKNALKQLYRIRFAVKD